MKESALRTKAKEFSLHVIAVCDTIDTKKNRGAVTNQKTQKSPQPILRQGEERLWGFWVSHSLER